MGYEQHNFSQAAKVSDSFNCNFPCSKFEHMIKFFHRLSQQDHDCDTKLDHAYIKICTK